MCIGHTVRMPANSRRTFGDKSQFNFVFRPFFVVNNNWNIEMSETRRDKQWLGLGIDESPVAVVVVVVVIIIIISTRLCNRIPFSRLPMRLRAKPSEFAAKIYGLLLSHFNFPATSAERLWRWRELYFIYYLQTAIPVQTIGASTCRIHCISNLYTAWATGLRKRCAFHLRGGPSHRF